MFAKCWLCLVVCGGILGLGVTDFRSVDTTYDAARADCPGQVACPLTGELVCKDRCPLIGATEVRALGEAPSCCIRIVSPERQ